MMKKTSEEYRIEVKEEEIIRLEQQLQCAEIESVRELISARKQEIKDLKEIIKTKPKHYPKPKYCKCNKGHTLVPVFNEKKNCYYWDCPFCIANGGN